MDLPICNGKLYSVSFLHSAAPTSVLSSSAIACKTMYRLIYGIFAAETAVNGAHGMSSVVSSLLDAVRCSEALCPLVVL